MFGDNFFALLFLGFEKVGCFNQGHDQALYCIPLAGQIAPGGIGADVGKFEAFLKICRADKDPIGHTFGKVGDSWGRGETYNPSGAKGCCPF